MGIQEKHEKMGGGGVESESMKWVVAGIAFRSPLKPILTIPAEIKVAEVDDEDECSTTPTSEESRIPAELPCPAAPRKRKPSSRCQFKGFRQFFTPPDLETAFIRHVEKA